MSIKVFIFIRFDFGFVQYNYMNKLNLIAFLLILMFKGHAQLRPEPPVRILTRRMSVPTFKSNFLKQFCTKCGPQSKSCLKSLKTISQMPQTDYFKPQSLQKNVYNINQANLSIGSVEVSCNFRNQSFSNNNMDYIIYMPISQSNSLVGVIIYFHPTLFGTAQVPTSNPDQINSIAGLFVTSAYAILFIDYVGYQKSGHQIHPYVQYPQCNVYSAILALNNALQKLKALFPSVDKFKLFAAGYSEGAAYALWFEKCLSQPEVCGDVKLDPAYEYRAAAAMDGPYDLVNVMKPFLLDHVAIQTFPQQNREYMGQTQLMVNFGKAPLIAMTLISYIYYSQGLENYEQKMNAKFWNMRCTLRWDQRKCKVKNHQYPNILQAIKSNELSIEIAKSIAHSAFGKKYNKRFSQYLGADPIDYVMDWTNSAYGLAQKQLMNSYLFDETISNATAIRNAPKQNVFLFTLQYDSIVSPNNTINYIAAHNDTGKVSNYTFNNRLHQVCTLSSQVHSRVDHNNAQVLANIFALSFIKNNTR